MDRPGPLRPPGARLGRMTGRNSTGRPGDPSDAGPPPGPRARDLLERARELAEQGEYEAAAHGYQRLLGHPEPIVHVAALLGLADARYRLDDEEGALQAWITATQAPETPLTWQAWVALAGARVRQGDLAGATRAYREAERRAPPQEQAAIASRLGWLNKEMGSEGSAQRYFGRARRGTTFTPAATWLILAVTVGIGLSSLISPASGELWFGLFGLDKHAVRDGELWRLVTVTLVHGNLLHLGFNMYALYIVGPIVEALYGRGPFLFFYVLMAAAGSVASYFVLENPSVGASGAVFGLFGLLMVSNWRHKPALGRQARALSMQIGILIVINLAIGFGLGGGGFMGGRIDNAAHIGGLVAGAWLGFAIAPRRFVAAAVRPGEPPAADRERGGPSPLLRAAAVLAVVAIIAGVLSLPPLWA
jgi:membrane associated rhomboid family serine protease